MAARSPVAKEAFRAQLPPGLLERKKQGFEIPVDAWLRGPLREMFRDAVLAPGRLSIGRIDRSNRWRVACTHGHHATGCEPAWVLSSGACWFWRSGAIATFTHPVWIRAAYEFHRQAQPIFSKLVEPTEARVSEGSLERIPVAIVGAGFIATYHLAVLRQLGGIEVVGACDPSQERLDALCKEWQIPSRASNLEELLRVCKPKVVHVLVPPAFHYEVTRQALLAGLHVLVEKPMALAGHECEELIGLAEKRITSTWA